MGFLSMLGFGCPHTWTKWEYFPVKVDNYNPNGYMFTTNETWRRRECLICGLRKEKKK